ncbi:MAG TPA: DUF4198 domain-containing protein, partial [Thermoanaerobaculia bacterium]|nr:DUF4198 domain-containing protein [Thermoanaerobaculia bacterium]
MRKDALAAGLLVLAALPGAVALAHDFWLEPSTFRPAAGATVAVGLRVGEDFLGDAVLRASSSIERFAVRARGGESEVAGVEGGDPAGWFRAREGAAVVAYASRPSPVELPPERFEAYLRRQGLEWVIAARERDGERGDPGREQFIRQAKAILAGARPFGAASRPIGLRYEIVPMGDPSFTSGVVHGRVLYEGEPAAGALVTALLRGDPKLRLTTRSDRVGAFSFTLPRPGVWLVESVWMVEAPLFSRADWQSFWASLTFETLPAPQ